MLKCGVKSNTTRSKTITRLESLVSRETESSLLNSIYNVLDKELMILKGLLMPDLTILEPSKMPSLIPRMSLLASVISIISSEIAILLLTTTTTANKPRISRPVRRSNLLKVEIVISLYRFAIPRCV